jgi:hypothetical protein
VSEADPSISETRPSSASKTLWLALAAGAGIAVSGESDQIVEERLDVVRDRVSVHFTRDL